MISFEFRHNVCYQETGMMGNRTIQKQKLDERFNTVHVCVTDGQTDR